MTAGFPDFNVENHDPELFSLSHSPGVKCVQGSPLSLKLWVPQKASDELNLDRLHHTEFEDW